MKGYRGNRNAAATVARDRAAIAGMRADRKRGMTFDQIGEKWGISGCTARAHTLHVLCPNRESPSKGRPRPQSVNTPDLREKPCAS